MQDANVNFLGGLQAISLVYEAAEIDNASEWAKFRYITLPHKTNMIFVIIYNYWSIRWLFNQPVTGGDHILHVH